MPMDPEYLGEYAPIEDIRVYCGNKSQLPDGYDRMGGLAECLTKGIGVGKSMKAREESKGNLRMGNLSVSRTSTEQPIMQKMAYRAPYFIVAWCLYAVFLSSNMRRLFWDRDKNKVDTAMFKRWLCIGAAGLSAGLLLGSYF
jgi:hypothetical protein